METHVYLAPISLVGGGEIFPEKRREEIVACNNEGIRLRKRAVWQLLTYALYKSRGMDISQSDIHREESGKWVLSDCFVSLSHSKSYLGVALSQSPVGLDLEDAARKPDKRLFSRIASERESALLEPTGIDLLALWTRKESVFKRTGGTFRPKGIEGESAKSFLYGGDEGVIFSVAGGDELAFYWIEDLSGNPERIFPNEI